MPRLKRVAIDTHHENIVLLSRNCTAYHSEQFQALAKLEVRHGGRVILAWLNIVDDDAIVGPEEVGLSEQAFDQFGVAEGAEVDLSQAAPPTSIEAIRAKIMGEVLSREQISAIISDIAANRYSKMEIAAFLVASAGFLTAPEVRDLTHAMAAVGTRMDWDHGFVVDKHSIGGVPGNRTTMIILPIVAAHGLVMPKTSSRAITSPAGTADTMEVLARVDLSIEEMRAVVAREGCCLAWGGHVNLSPADDILISVERPLGLDAPGQMVASILSKKVAAGVTHLVIDIPVGPSVKVRSQAEAIQLRKLFEYVGDDVGLHLDVEITRAEEPIGRGVGPVLEARDVMKVLRGDADGLTDLRDKAVFLAGRVLEFDPGLRGGEGEARARELLDSGAALDAMERIIARQGPPPANVEPGPMRHEIRSPRAGRVAAIDCFRIARIARTAGAPMNKGAGVDLLKKCGDAVRRGEPLYRIHAEFAPDFDFACGLAEEDSGYAVAS